MDIKDITTVEQAKALAFDCIQAIEQQQNNLRALQGRIQEQLLQRLRRGSCMRLTMGYSCNNRECLGRAEH